MVEGSARDDRRYRAFLSYSHRDAVFAARLHRRLEGYVLPRRLGAERRLSPIFKDREELPAADDLSAQVRAALAISDCLIVVCSPDAAASPWVAREIETFRALHPGRPVLAALARGEPAEAFPPALTAGGLEPLAADFRKSGDGERLGLLKLAAGLAGVGVDQLVQRDAQRRLRGVMAVTAVSLAAVLAMGVMTAFALNARAEAERHRAEAEGLVEFMLTDLRDQLKGVGRLDLMTSVNKRALDYFRRQGPGISADGEIQMSLALLALGEDDFRRGDVDAAKRNFAQAREITGRLLARDPTNPHRIWAHGQSEFWDGFTAFSGPDPKSAQAAFDRYLVHASALVKIAPGNPEYLREAGYAHGNLCSLHLASPRDAAAALAACQRALDLMQAAVRLGPPSEASQLDLANRFAWLADAHYVSGDLSKALETRKRQEAILVELRSANPRSLRLRQEWVALQRALGILEISSRRHAEARGRLTALLVDVREMIAIDPENADWKAQEGRVLADLKLISTRH